MKKRKLTEIVVMVCITITLLTGMLGSTGETLVANAAQKSTVYQQYSKKIDKRVKQIKNDDSKKQCGHFEKEIGNEFSSCDRQKLE